MRILKKVGIALLGLVFILILAAAIGMWYLFTPEKLSPIVNKQAKEYLACNTMIEKVEPTFFSTYPFFGLEITNLCLTENTNASKIDTLLYAPKCFASINVISYLLDGNIKLDPFLVEDGYLNFKIDSLGHSNLDILKSSSNSSEANSEAASFGDIDINNVEFKNFNASYTDESTFRKADINNLNAKLELKYSKEKQYFDLDMQLNKLLFTTSDSIALYIEAQNCDLHIKSKAKDKNLFNSNLKLVCKAMSVSMTGDTLLSQLKFDTHLPFNANLSENSCDFKMSKLLINDEQAISFNGHVNLLKDNSISADMSYSTKEMNIEKIIALIPKAYSEPLKNISAKGYAKVSGSITGLISETSTPLVTTHIDYYKGEIKYTGYPIVKDIKLSMSTKVDLNKKQNSNVTINSSYAKIEHSSVSLKGEILNILETPVYDIYSKGDFNLADFKSFIPKDQNMSIRGSLNGNLHTQFSQSDLDKEAYHRIYLTGNFETQNFYACYDDSIRVNLPQAKLKLNLPSQSRLDKNLRFANISIDAPNMDINMSPTIRAATENLELSVNINQLSQGVSAPISSCHFKFNSLMLRSIPYLLVPIMQRDNLNMLQALK